MVFRPRTSRIVSYAGASIVSGAIVASAIACGGGPGSGLSEGFGASEPSKPTNEKAPNSTERAGQAAQPSTTSPSPVPSAPVANSNDCAGAYTCTGGKVTGTVLLTASSNGNCTVAGVNYLVQPDGNITQNGQTIGTWTVSGNDITLNITGAGTTTCVKATSGSSGGSGGSPTPTVTATPQPAPAPAPVDAGH